jgi:TetR/AcrR family transcriptional repressor of nem operon
MADSDLTTESKSARTRRRIVGHATELVHRQGLKGTSIDEIIRAAGVTKGSFYFHFASKEELGYAVIDQAAAYVLAGLLAMAEVQNLSAGRRLEGMFDLIRQAVESHDCSRGCILGNLALEMSDMHDGYRQHLQGIFGQWRDLFQTTLEEMQAAGELAPNLDAAAFAMHSLSALEGGILLSKVQRDPLPLRTEIEYLLRELDSHRTKED